MYIYIYMYIYIHIFENLTKYIKIYSTPLSFSVLCHHFAKKIRSKSPDPEKILQSVDIQKSHSACNYEKPQRVVWGFSAQLSAGGVRVQKRRACAIGTWPERQDFRGGGRGRWMFFWHLSAAAVYCLFLNDIARGEDPTKLGKILCPALMSGVGKKLMLEHAS